MPPTSHSVTQLLQEWRAGDETALDRLVPFVYEELRLQATRYLRRERPGHTLQTTALIHEAYLRLVNAQDIRWQSRAHFFAVAANLMRRILVDHARKNQAAKRAATNIKLSFAEEIIVANKQDVDVLAVDEALDRLAAIDPQQAKIVELRFFTGLSVEETAEALEISPRTVKRDWAVARVWLHREISKR